MTTLKFTKMHGLGNDFMVIDGINQTFTPDEKQIVAWSNRFTGIGFDQLLLVERAQNEGVDFRYRIFNADGGEVEQCGNGARCFVKFVSEKGLTQKQEIVVETKRGIIKPRLNDNGLVTVNMGQPRFAPEEVPFMLRANETAGKKTYIVVNGIDSAEMSMVSMGNPHAVMLVDNVATAPVEQWGSALQNHERFPARVNVGFMQIVDIHNIKLRVFERGSGETQACGTGACAAVVAGVRLGLLASGENVRVSLPGGDLHISWQDGGDVMMTGPAVSVFDGQIDL
ncbi:diaminopimelate epimerase [Kingella negevensis]|uniref:Diaminopimelate epimerase n=1 Tax=Kingella negevensis TaxID=1522312 RepID=A0A238HG21_9NEIS|nr:diaminopimelate epimerase [Kingella negevensis]MDK4680484.1 diaminopimelate epimerase [Kingella negevensis]MDK4681793.1 diaminopimelate epimerase [Kingella negevensis]MDK4684999.1 diaminopimelate epimerase [Kingella negevensis]MDK4689990.1 diaminopimelate epimerase [Kingella negevensis]MDK4692665.1 diaminopimelate epimerase [Kingella negevensis]